MWTLRIVECDRGWKIYFESWKQESSFSSVIQCKTIPIRTIQDYKQAKKFARDVAMFERLELVIQNKYGGVLYRRNYRKGLPNVTQRSRNLPD